MVKNKEEVPKKKEFCEKKRVRDRQRKDSLEGSGRA